MGRPSVLVLYGNGQGGFAAPTQRSQLGGQPAALAARDITGDMIADLLVADQVSNVVALFLGSHTRSLIPSDSVSVSREPVGVVAADFDGDGRYDSAAANNFLAGSISVLTNISGPAVLRGDANSDQRVTAADTLAVLREVADRDSVRVEEIGAPGTYQAGPGADANGDGLVTAQDALAVARRIFPR